MTGLRFACQRSGNCCARPGGRVRVAAGEIPALAAVTGLSPRGFGSRYLSPGPEGDWLLKEQPDGACVFLEHQDGRARCVVYAARPERCRTFPFWPELEVPGPARDEALRFCPGLRVVDV